MSKFIIAALFLISTAIAGVYIAPVYKENILLKKELDKSHEELIDNRIEISKRRTLIQDLKDNPAAINRIAREKFNFCGRGERVYKFVDEDQLKRTTHN